MEISDRTRSRASAIFRRRRPALRAALLCFTVLPLSLACEGDGPWDDRTFLLRVPKTSWSEPTPAIGDEIGDFVPSFLVGMESTGSDSYRVTLGTANADGEQDPCNPTTVLEAQATPYPGVQIGPGEVELRIEHVTEPVVVTGTVHDFTLIDVLPGDSAASEGELTATMDIREIYSLFTQLVSPTPDIVCTALDSFNAPCEACPTDDETYCLSLKATGLGAEETSADSLEPIDDVDESCEE